MCVLLIDTCAMNGLWSDICARHGIWIDVCVLNKVWIDISAMSGFCMNIHDVVPDAHSSAWATDNREA